MDDVKINQRPLQASTERQMKFSMRDLPMLKQGTTYDPLATAENLWASVKVYASGGENALHSHSTEDHLFVIMQGKATFFFGDGSSTVARQFEGVMIPRNVQYRFEADTAENLVLLRVGGGVREVRGVEKLSAHGTPLDVNAAMTYADGAIKLGDEARNGETGKQRIYAQGEFFAPG